MASWPAGAVGEMGMLDMVKKACENPSHLLSSLVNRFEKVMEVLIPLGVLKSNLSHPIEAPGTDPLNIFWPGLKNSIADTNIIDCFSTSRQCSPGLQ